MHVHSRCLQICRRSLVEFLYVVLLVSTMFFEDLSFQFVEVLFAGFEPETWIFRVWLHSFFLAYLRWNTRLLRPHMTQSKDKKEVKSIEPKKIIVTNKKEFHMYSSEVTDLFSLARHVVKSTNIKQAGRSRETQISSPCTRFISLCLLVYFFVFSGPGWGVKHRRSKTKQTKRRKFYNLFPKVNYRSFIIQKMRANTVQVLK